MSLVQVKYVLIALVERAIEVNTRVP